MPITNSHENKDRPKAPQATRVENTRDQKTGSVKTRRTQMEAKGANRIETERRKPRETTGQKTERSHRPEGTKARSHKGQDSRNKVRKRPEEGPKKASTPETRYARKPESQKARKPESQKARRKELRLPKFGEVSGKTCPAAETTETLKTGWAHVNKRTHPK